MTYYARPLTNLGESPTNGSFVPIDKRLGAPLPFGIMHDVFLMKEVGLCWVFIRSMIKRYRVAWNVLIVACMQLGFSSRVLHFRKMVETTQSSTPSPTDGTI